ncbi:hypothetical protein BCR34DRAFT_596422 [Clohesyomyces aquaticus]|uniref:BTB domain-containing protein n=1 Tax=Clohesyomyces aquaticus TaxID=1231657 RepID=A0A1Y2A6R0_9PLEO|nr:hypothetical protein BCR34DRAFT_596422 [Clohesyomyces aquaticus]
MPPIPHNLERTNLPQAQNSTSLVLEDDFPFAVHALLDFVSKRNYTGAFLAARAQIPHHLSALEFHIHAYIISTKYSVAALREFAADSFTTGMEWLLNAGVEALPQQVEGFMRAAVFLWKGTEDGDEMRELVLGWVVEGWKLVSLWPLFRGFFLAEGWFWEAVRRKAAERGLELVERE